MVMFCTEFPTFFNGTVLPITAMATIVTAGIIGLSYMLANMISNPKVTLWAKTEAIQLIVSIFSVFFIIAVVNSFCAINMTDVANIFSIPTTGVSTTNVDVYTAANNYLTDTATYAHNALVVVRYHLEAYTVFAYTNAFICDYKTGAVGWGCIFGYAGDSQQPLGGYGAATAALNIFFNSMVIALFTVFNSLFILLLVFKGFVFLFLPLGVFMRSMPYMRTFGALFIALAMSFLIVYPFMNAVFYLMEGILLDAPNFSPLAPSQPMSYYDEKAFPNNENNPDVGASLQGSDAIKSNYFDNNNGRTDGHPNPTDNLPGAIMFAADAFVAAVFLPAVALLGTIASVVYIAKLFGEEIDLSRLTQLV